MAVYDLVVRAPRAVIEGVEQQAAVAVRDGVIVGVYTGSEARAIGLAGDHNVELGEEVVLLPGFVDLAMSTTRSGADPEVAFAGLTRAAGAGGMTTVIDMPGPGEFSATDPEAFRQRQWDASGQTAVDCAFWAPAGRHSLGNLAAWAGAGAFGFVGAGAWDEDSSPAPLDTTLLRDVMAEVADLDRVLLVRPDADDEPGDTERILEAAEATACRTHLFHLSDADALGHVARAKESGRQVTASTCPQFLTVTEEQLAWMSESIRPGGTFRDGRNRERLWELLADGTIDAVASRKGVSSVRYTASVVWSGARMRGIGIEQITDWLASAPAQIAGLPDRGALREGNRADFTYIETDAAYVVTGFEQGGTMFGRPYCLDQPLAGTVRGTYLGGTAVDEWTTLAGRPVRAEAAGRFGGASGAGSSGGAGGAGDAGRHPGSGFGG